MTPGTHTCPGLCGRILECALFACPACTRRLPLELRTRIAVTFWDGDWEAHSRAMADAMHHYTAGLKRPIRRRS